MAFSTFDFDFMKHTDRRLQEAERRLAEAQKRLESEGDRLAREGERLMREGARLLEREFGATAANTPKSNAGASHSSARSESMGHFLIAYEPKTAGFGRYDALTKTLQKSEAWWNFVDHVWVITTSESADVLWQRLAPLFGKNDNVIVLELSSGPDRQGWLPEQAWDWFNRHMPRGKQAKLPAAPTKLGIPYDAFQGAKTLIMPEGLTVRVIRGADGVYFTDKKIDEPAPPKVEPKVEHKPVDKPVEKMVHSAFVAQPESAPAPTHPAGKTLKCDFCGCEAPASEWGNGDCPRCGIHNS